MTTGKTLKADQRIMVTAGPTREYIDPVRYLSNRSSGNMGYAIAKECHDRGFQVCLITGPVNLTAPSGVELVKVLSAREMLDEVMVRQYSYDCLIMAAAVSDFTPRKKVKGKIKKQERLNFEFVKTADILLALKNNKDLLKVGFALETEDQIENARNKLSEKGLDLIVLNSVGEGQDPFGESMVQYTLIENNGNSRHLDKIDKKGFAKVLLDLIERS